MWPFFLPMFSNKEIRQKTSNIKPLYPSRRLSPSMVIPREVPSHTESELTYVTHRKLCKWQCVNSEAFHKRHFSFHLPVGSLALGI